MTLQLQAPQEGQGEGFQSCSPHFLKPQSLSLKLEHPLPSLPNSGLWLCKSRRGSGSIKYSKRHPLSPCLHNKSSGNVRVPRISEPTHPPCSAPPARWTGSTLSPCALGIHLTFMLFLTSIAPSSSQFPS